MTNGEAVNWLINISADIGGAKHSDLWHYEQALSEIREMLETEQPEIIRCKDCIHFNRNAQSVCGPYNGCEVWTDDGNEIEVKPDDYCSYAERRTDEAD